MDAALSELVLLLLVSPEEVLFGDALPLLLLQESSLCSLYQAQASGNSLVLKAFCSSWVQDIIQVPADVMNAVYWGVPLPHMYESDLTKLGDEGSLVQSLYCSFPAFYIHCKQRVNHQLGIIFHYLVASINAWTSRSGVVGWIAVLSMDWGCSNQGSQSSGECEFHD